MAMIGRSTRHACPSVVCRLSVSYELLTGKQRKICRNENWRERYPGQDCPRMRRQFSVEKVRNSTSPNDVKSHEKVTHTCVVESRLVVVA